MRLLVNCRIALLLAAVCCSVESSSAYSFGLTPKTFIESYDGTDYKLYYFAAADGDKILFSPSANWEFKNETASSLTILDPTAPTAKIVVNFQQPFPAKDDATLREQIISDAVSDLEIEGAEQRTAFNVIKFPGYPEYKLYSTNLIHNKNNRTTSRVAFYLQMNKDEVLRVRMSTPGERSGDMMAALQNWLLSFRSSNRTGIGVQKKPEVKPGSPPATVAPKR